MIIDEDEHCWACNDNGESCGFCGVIIMKTKGLTKRYAVMVLNGIFTPKVFETLPEAEEYMEKTYKVQPYLYLYIQEVYSGKP